MLDRRRRMGEERCKGAWGRPRKGRRRKAGGAIANGMTTLRWVSPRCTHVAPEATRDVVTEATQANVAWRTRAGARGGGTEASLP